MEYKFVLPQVLVLSYLNFTSLVTNILHLQPLVIKTLPQNLEKLWLYCLLFLLQKTIMRLCIQFECISPEAQLLVTLGKGLVTFLFPSFFFSKLLY